MKLHMRNGHTAAAEREQTVNGSIESIFKPQAVQSHESGNCTMEVQKLDVRSLPRPGIQLPRVEHKADAPLTRLRRSVVMAVHALLLLSILAFIVYQIAGPWLGLSPQSRRLAQATIIGDPLVEVGAPVEGRFIAERPLPNGTQVYRGALIGRVHETLTAEKLTSARRALRSLRERQLILDEQRIQVTSIDQQAASSLDREVRETTFRIVELENEIDKLEKLEERLNIYSPVSGKIHFGLPASMPVKAHQTVAIIWPNEGGLLVEIEAPLETVHRVIKANRIQASFSTPIGEVPVVAIPLAASLRTFTVETGVRERTELWGKVQCTPENIPDGARSPGLIGYLR
jgi:hypothetical protein